MIFCLRIAGGPALRLPHRALHDALGCLRLWLKLEDLERGEAGEAQWEEVSLGKEVGQ